MSEEKKIDSYYLEQLPTLIEKLKNMVERNYEIIDRKLDAELKDDKLHTMLKARRMAAEDADWGLKKIDELTKLLNPDADDKGAAEVKTPVQRHRR